MLDGATIGFILMPVIDIPLFIFIGRLFFGSWGGFLGCGCVLVYAGFVFGSDRGVLG